MPKQEHDETSLWQPDDPILAGKGQADGSTPIRVPPQDLHAEQAVLGSMLLDPEASERVFAMLDYGDFYRQGHSIIYRAMQEVYSRGEPVDLITVSAQLRTTEVPRNMVGKKGAPANAQELTGGPEYLTGLIGEVPTTAHVVKYADTVRDHSIRRQAISLCIDMCDAGYYSVDVGYGDKPVPTRELLSGLIGKAMTVEDRLNFHGKVIHFSDLQGSQDRIRQSVIDRAQWHRTRAHFGFPPLDKRIMGLPTPGATWIQGLHKMGKTILKNMALLETAYSHGWHVASFDTEMDLETQTFDRLVKMLTGFGIEDIAPDDGLGEIDQEALEVYLDWIDTVRRTANVTHISANGMTPEEVVSRLRSIHRQKPVLLWIVDHVQQLHLRGPSHEAMQQAGQLFKRESMNLRNAFLGLTQVTISQDGLVFSKGGRGPEEASDLNIYVDRKGKTLAEKQDSPVGCISIQGSRNSKGGRWETVLTDKLRFELREPEPPEVKTRRDKRDE